MQNRLITIKYIPIAILLLLAGCKEKKESELLPEKQATYRSLAVQQDGKEDGAWGYVILLNDKIIIQQFTIPALEGNKHFEGREPAEVVGKLVAEKLNHAKSPGITKKELDSLGIIQ